MILLTGEQIAGFLTKYIDKEKQMGKFSFDLTVKSITQLEGVGRVDFGGSEFEWGQRSILSPKRIGPGDDFGWWKLSKGEYIVRLNEAVNLPENTVVTILPHDRIAQNGAQHAPALLQSSQEHIEILLQVGCLGIEIKENARVSYLVASQF